MTTLLILKDQFVINKILVNDEDVQSYHYPFEHDEIIVQRVKDDITEEITWNVKAEIGDWKNPNDGLFYRPLNNTP